MKRTLALLLILGLAACSKSPGNAPHSSATPSDLPTADLSTPDSAYTPITQPRQVWVMYDALSGEKPSDMMLWSIDPSLMGANPFQKRDKLATLLPQIDAEMAAVKGHRYISFNDGLLASYDFNQKAFGFQSAFFNGFGAPHAKLAGVGLIDVAATNAPDFQWISVPDEAKARDVQARMTSGWIPSVKIWAYVQGAEKVNGITQTLHIQIVKVQVLDPVGHVLIEQTAKEG
jgi:hypothetical protein